MERQTGVLEAFNYERGYGFIYQRILKEGKPSIKFYFVHIRSIIEGEPILKSIATFDIKPSPKGEQAINVSFQPLETPTNEVSNGTN